MKKLLLAAATLVTLAITGCETHDHHAGWEHRDRDHDEWRHGAGGPPEHVIEVQPPVTIHREYPDYRR